MRNRGRVTLAVLMAPALAAAQPAPAAPTPGIADNSAARSLAVSNRRR